MKTTNSHSEVIDNFRNWLAKWDDNISTQDDLETQSMISEKLIKGFSHIEKLLHSSDQKAMIKSRGNFIIGSNESNEKEVLAMFENQKKSWYKNLKKLSHDLTYINTILNHIYEIKNRRTYECFQLRSENARLRSEIERLKKC